MKHRLSAWIILFELVLVFIPANQAFARAHEPKNLCLAGVPILDSLLRQPTNIHHLTEREKLDSSKETQTPKQQNLKIPFTYSNGYILVDVFVNERLPLKFIFDTGSKHTILTDEASIPFLGQPPEEEIKLVGSDLSEPIVGNLVRGSLLRVGDVNLKNQSLILLGDSRLDLTKLTGEKIHGILGIGSFVAYGLKIDFQREELELVPFSNIRPSKRTKTIPIHIKKSKAYIEVNAKIHPEKSQNLSLLLDTGASLALLIHANESDSTLFPPKTVTGIFGYGLGGYLTGYVGRSELLQLGDIHLPDIITHFQTFPEVSTRKKLVTREGIIGNGILDNYIVLINFPGKELHLTPTRKTRRKKVKYDRSGLKLVQDGKNLDRLRVQHVIKNSPAGRAGIKTGDELIKIGFVPTKLTTLYRIEKMLKGRVGKLIRLSFVRDGERIEKKIILEELI